MDQTDKEFEHLEGPPSEVDENVPSGSNGDTKPKGKGSKHKRGILLTEYLSGKKKRHY